MTINQTYSTFHHCLFHNQFHLYIHHSPSNSLFNHNDSPSPSIHPLILFNKHLNNYIWWSIGLTHTQSRRNPLHLHALLARFLLSLRSKPPTTQRHSVLPLIPLLILPQRTRIHRRRALPFFSLLNPPTTRKASKKSCRWMGRIFPASTCIKSSTSRIYASLASLLAPYRTHRGLLT